MPLINRVKGAKKLVAIVIVTPPTKLEYKYGTTFNISGISVKAIYSNKQEKNIPVNNLVYSPTSALTHEDISIKISYTEKDILKYFFKNTLYNHLKRMLLSLYFLERCKAAFYYYLV